MSLIERNLVIISKEAKGAVDRRYVAKPFNGEQKNWGVWDQSAGRYLRDHEVEALSVSEVREPWTEGVTE